MYNYVWFRSDLRIADNPALWHSLNANPAQQTRGLFCITIQQWRKHNWGDNKISFVLQSLYELQNDLATLNIELIIRESNTFKDCAKDIVKFLNSNKASNLYYNIEYELNENLRDQKIASALKSTNIKIHPFHDQCLIPPGIILNKNKSPYSIFTPFKASCYKYLHKHPVKLYPTPKAQNCITPTAKINQQHIDFFRTNPILKFWPSYKAHVVKRLKLFCGSKIASYKEKRDFPAESVTSTLSPYLACGRISVRECFNAAIATNKNEFDTGNQSVICWINELLWRDFYKQIIFHYPNICKGINYNRKYDKLKWSKNLELLTDWQRGETGIPIIDAAMRQLIQTGWMHNRLRMIVAMYLTKNLLIDWREGEHFFSQHLIDLDFASNNGGWQWSASTGTDAAPYFRIFNPVEQSLRFDPEGKFIKKFCPELAKVPLASLHDPSASLSPKELANLNYPQRNVDLSETRKRALAYFKAAINNSNL